MWSKKLAAFVLAAHAFTMACGGSEPPPRSADKSPRRVSKRQESKVQAYAEIGGLNEDDVEATFKRSMNSLERCFRKGTDRLDLLNGDLEFVVKIDESGSPVNARLETSSLGDRETERCMLNALKNRSWPAPVGGRFGIARKSYSFDLASGGRPPVRLDADFAKDVLAKREFSDAVSGCGRGSGYTATLYVGTQGRVLAASVTASDDAGEDAVDCLSEALEQLQFPSPGSWPGKLTFRF